MLQEIRPFLEKYIDGDASRTIINLTLLVGIALVSVAAYYITKLLLRLVQKLILKTATTWDDDLLNNKFMSTLAHLAPAIIVRWMLPALFGESASEMNWLESVTDLYIIWAIVMVFVIFISNLYAAFLLREKLQAYAVKGIFQMFKLIIIAIGVIVSVSILIGKTPTAVLTALGASAAVLMLVFQDIILGLVASVQLTANKMLERGDWIESGANNLNGEVLEITLTAVKVRNWDNSVSTVPPYSLIKGSFRNYQPMRQSGGRRVTRAIYIDVNTVRFCTPDELTALQNKGLLDGISLPDAGKTVNLKLLRLYLDNYLATHPAVNTDMTCMVRQLTPTNAGLPVELYFFTKTVEWKQYENDAADIFDHVYAVVQEFGLKMFQRPSGTDLEKCADK